MSYQSFVTTNYNLGFKLPNEVLAKISWSIENGEWVVDPDAWNELDAERRDQLVRLLMWINENE